jgi:pimeloyl-ACP methyl ester carboxylesterase
VILIAVSLVALAAAITMPAPPARAAATAPKDWNCAGQAPGDTVQLAPLLADDTNPDGTAVKSSPDRRGKYVPIVMVHGWVGQDTHDGGRKGVFSGSINLTPINGQQAHTTRSLIGQLQRLPGAAVFTFDYRDYAARWVTDDHLGPALGRVIDCLYKASGGKVIVVAHSMGGLIARYVSNTPVCRR